MTRPNGNAINASVRKNVDRYEAMLVSGRREYFDEDDLLDVADYYYNDMSRLLNGSTDEGGNIFLFGKA